MTPEERLALLAKAAEHLFGVRWQSDLARYLDVSIRTVQRWVAGVNDVPNGVLQELVILIRTRAIDALALASLIEVKIRGEPIAT